MASVVGRFQQEARRRLSPLQLVQVLPLGRAPGDLSWLHWLRRYTLEVGGVPAVCPARNGPASFLVMAGGFPDP